MKLIKNRVRTSVVSRGSDEHRSGRSASYLLRGPGNRIFKEERMKLRYFEMTSRSNTDCLY